MFYKKKDCLAYLTYNTTYTSCHDLDLFSTIFSLSPPPATQFFSDLNYISYYVLLFTFSCSFLTLSWWRSLSCRNQSIYLQNKPKDWFLYDRDLRHESVNDKPLHMFNSLPSLLFITYYFLRCEGYEFSHLSVEIRGELVDCLVLCFLLKETYFLGETWFL